jgi:hypothetical protein
MPISGGFSLFFFIAAIKEKILLRVGDNFSE